MAARWPAPSAPGYVLVGITYGGATTSAAKTDSGSDHALRADVARTTYGVTGGTTGSVHGSTSTVIRIGILSDSFNVLGGAATDESDGDLPSAANVDIVKEGPAGSSDEGRSMAELVHKIAPGAQIYFYSAETANASAAQGMADFATGIQTLASDGCQIIIDDVAYFDEPFYQEDGIVQRAIDTVTSQGRDLLHRDRQ